MTSSSTQPVEVCIAYIGGGSRGWAHTLMNDLALCQRLSGEVRLYDIDRTMALLNARWGRRVSASRQARSRWKFTVARTLDAALRGADFVVASIQPGSIELMRHDLEIPARYGILHTVGDTVGPAGLCRSLRAVAAYEKIARAIEQYSPKAWVINYTNPMSVCTAALYAVFPQVKAFGCCHEVFGTQRMLAELVEHYFRERPKRDDIRISVMGVNHFTWIDRAEWNGIDLLKLYRRHWARRGMVRRVGDDEIAKMGYFEHRGQVTYDLFRRFGLLPAAGERHLVEFLPFYARDEATLHRWGVKATPYSYRIERHTRLPAEFRRRLADKRPFKLTRSGEQGTRQMMALCGLGDLRTNVNLPNVGQIANLPRGAVVETNASFSAGRLSPEFAGSLPPGAHAWVHRAAANQQLILQAALKRDKDLAFQALLNDPLTNLPTDKAWKMFNEMLRATRSALPGWR